MATKCAINGRQWGAYDGRRQTCSSTNNVGRRYEVILLVIDQVKPK